MTVNNTVSFARNILPLFRPGDITCMAAKGVFLGDAQWMCDPAGNHGFDDYGNARRVFAALSSGYMPPGPDWPQERLDIFSNWMTDGFQS
jgi:hypothetical protein